MITFFSISIGRLSAMKDQMSIAWLGPDAGVPESLAILGGVGLATLLAVIWALFFRKRRRLRREHRRRNPTLAETRGLPPVRAERPAGLNP